MTDEADVLSRTDGALATVTINRPGKRNALTAAMYAALAEAVNAASADPDVRVIVLTGAGGSFSAGNDLGDFIAASGSATARDDDQPVRRFQEAVMASTAVLIAEVDGPAVGIGATVLLHCDLVYATERSYLQFPFVNLGLVPEFGSSALLPQRVGRPRAADILLFGDRFTATRAREIGLVNDVLPDADALRAHVAERVETLLAKPAGALREIRALLRVAEPSEPHERMVHESGIFTALLDDPDTKARITALLASRSSR
ncbi:MAG TPA: enoyl-CoA hydratase-related protein [Pseudonocardiaceae bacterium]|jgi:enoyl-CoA hydratase/carnithine racemase|nr:enoyl-CoA hydratase-related protein [Pseudonocardiaceae bacterium]